MNVTYVMSTAKFGSIFFEVSGILSKQNKKMNYSDWMDLRDIAIGSSRCKCKGKENKEVRGSDYIQVKVSTNTIFISCMDCTSRFKVVNHIDTAKEFRKYLEKVIAEDNKNTNTIKKVDKETKKEYNNNIINNENKKENEDMMNTNKMFKGLDFGKANKDLYRLSHLGLAIKNAEGTFVSYDKDNQELVDVDLFDFDLDGMIYKMPVAYNQVVVGDVIVHSGKSMLVQEIKGSNLEVIDPTVGEIKTIMPTKNMFGFNFFTKILCLMDMSNLGASSDNPFGNMMPMLMMSAMGEEKGNNDMMTMMMMSQMMGGDSSMGDMFSNPMMMMAMMSGDNNMGDMLPMMMMMQGGTFGNNKPVAQVSTGGCGGNCTCNQEK